MTGRNEIRMRSLVPPERKKQVRAHAKRTAYFHGFWQSASHMCVRGEAQNISCMYGTQLHCGVSVAMFCVRTQEDSRRTSLNLQLLKAVSLLGTWTRRLSL